MPKGITKKLDLSTRTHTGKSKRALRNRGHIDPNYSTLVLPTLGGGWYKDFCQVAEFRRQNHGKWPTRDSEEPGEVWLSNRFRSNLELYWANRLSPDKMNYIDKLLSGHYDRDRRKRSKGQKKETGS